MPGLVGHRLIFVTGKGGVGKSTVSAALAIAGAKSGLRTLLTEVSGQDRVQRAFAREGQLLEEAELAPGLFAVSVDPEAAMEEYLGIRMGAVGRALGSTKLFQGLTMATPGMREMQTMAKIWELAHPERPAGRGAPYDLVVVDAPATAYAIGLLRTPRTFAGLAQAGPVADGARTIAAMVADAVFTGYVAVTTAEEPAVTETLSLRDALAADGLSISTVVVNRLRPDRFAPDEAAQLEGWAADAPDSVRAALRAAVFEHRRASVEKAGVARITGDMDVPLITLPFHDGCEFGHGVFHALADKLAEAWPAHAANSEA